MRVIETEAKIFTVAEFIDVLNTFFKAKEVRLTGEICELKRAASGHVYFTIKDSGNGESGMRGGANGSAVMDGIIWSRNYELCGVALEVGMEVILTGHPNIYAPSGRLSFVADTVELVGEGALKKAYDALYKKLAEEGAFAPERKRALPAYPTRIGVVTSMKGAVIHDFLNNLGKFGFKVRAVDSRVEGQQAVAPLIAALKQMRREAEAGRVEVLAIMRGGGSLESLQAFNNEKLVRAVMEFPVPVIAGIGHDQDVPLAALAADFMVSTPTAVAHLLGDPWEQAFEKLREVPHLVQRVEREFARVRDELAAAWEAFTDATAAMIRRAGESLAHAEQLLRVHDPRRQLKLGYAIARNEQGMIVKSVKAVARGDLLSTELADGTIRSRVDGEPAGTV